MKRATKEGLRETLFMAAFLGGVAVVLAGAQAVAHENSPIEAYQEQYTDDGKCFEGTEYDQALGAKATVTRADQLVIAPSEGNSQKLLLDYTQDGFILRSTTFFAGDRTTADILTDC